LPEEVINAIVREGLQREMNLKQIIKDFGFYFFQINAYKSSVKIKLQPQEIIRIQAI